MTRREKQRKEKKAKDAVRKEEKRIEKVRQIVPLTVLGAKPNKCGECQACCFVIAIGGDVNTPSSKNYEECVHQCEQGCNIYSSRPQECKTYYCMYQQGLLTGGEDMRPDKLGVLIDFRGSDDGHEVLVLWETRPNALQEPRVKQLIRDLHTKSKLVIMVNEYGFNFDKSEAYRKSVLVPNPWAKQTVMMEAPPSEQE